MKKEKKKEPSERKPNWKEYTATVEDIEQFLSDNILLRHNVVTGRVETHVPYVPPKLGGDRGLNVGVGDDLYVCSDPHPPNLGGLWQRDTASRA